jgi:hypothetical protein
LTDRRREPVPGTAVPQTRCECHDEVMPWTSDSRYTAGGYWRCRVKREESRRKRYAERPGGLWYSHKLLMNRRNKALYRRRDRVVA